ncbi:MULTISPECIES: DNA adenine methylase [Bacillus cereus group]|nr:MULTISPECIES: Dam family site-specific DNA-(adenine-N6)-methyltransferase [Bacillus cereus group]MBY5228941.1 DNA methyltransferase [Bacillus paranthracis]MCY9250058.1 Dam family site-specific DNA-(adenine-N6)-methyltransferase [Bacillus paranthracis]MDA1498081.1 Dam family site-specific DNA-(adenine-N6)-methyltransferase [Bacillus cereus group sp. TH41-1LC]MDA1684185.1 Dam family site-specific DNA-(adenine-N6)-methyltransferase [Bacillus cereus group sp. m2-21]MDA1694823.1 Dam family site-
MNKKIIPFLKWAGGKRWFVQQYPHLLPENYNRYFEPFLGSGVVYFTLCPNDAVLNDRNKELIDAYKGIKFCWKKVYDLLIQHDKLHSKEYYYDIRSTSFTSLKEKAARMIYLNRTCFNGIYRVNKQGQFNVPVGSKTSVLLETDDFGELAKLLKKAKILNQDFEKIIDQAQYNDFVFVDPPYTVRHNQNGFVKYNEVLFSWDDQVRLSKSLIRAKNRGVKILMTNASHQSIRELYESEGFDLQVVSRFSSISASALHRDKYEELVIKVNMD